jgi:hypothetical protein
VNPFTKQPHTASYKKILEMRKKLPVYAQMKEFYEMVSSIAPQKPRGGQSSPSQAAPTYSLPSTPALGQRKLMCLPARASSANIR